MRITYGRKTVTYSVDVRSFLGRRKVKKRPWLPRSGNSDWVGVPKGTLSSTKRRTTQLFRWAQETSWRSRKLVRNTRKRCHEVHPVTVLLRKRKSDIETGIYHLPQKKSNQSRWRRKTDLNGCRQKENREPTDACVLEFSIEIVSRCSGRRRESSMEEVGRTKRSTKKGKKCLGTRRWREFMELESKEKGKVS
jgi:hypothetical protein